MYPKTGFYNNKFTCNYLIFVGNYLVVLLNKYDITFNKNEKFVAYDLDFTIVLHGFVHMKNIYRAMKMYKILLLLTFMLNVIVKHVGGAYVCNGYL